MRKHRLGQSIRQNSFSFPVYLGITVIFNFDGGGERWLLREGLMEGWGEDGNVGDVFGGGERLVREC